MNQLCFADGETMASKGKVTSLRQHRRSKEEEKNEQNAEIEGFHSDH